MADHKAEWEIELEKLAKPMPVQAKADRMLLTQKLLGILGDIERAATRAKNYLATGMTAEMRVELDKLRALLKVLEKGAPMSVDVVASLLKAGVSEKALKEIYGATDEEIQRARRLLESRRSSPPQLNQGGESEGSSSENPDESPELEMMRETVSFPSIKELAKVGAT